MESPSGIKHNLLPREENLYPVSEGELDSLATFSFTTSLWASLGIVFVGVAIPAALDVKRAWTFDKCATVIDRSALARACGKTLSSRGSGIR